jgi:hypothetical protein
MSNDYYFVHISYLSELWAVQDLQWGAAEFGIDLSEHIQDEINHAKILKALLKDLEDTRQLVKDVDDVSFSFQNIIFRNTGRFNLAKFTNFNAFQQMHNIMERRAAWIYKTYVLGGSNEKIKKALRSIIDDEKGHVHDIQIDDFYARQIYELDQHLFLTQLRKKYNNLNLLKSDQFWNDYYQRQTLE